MTGDTTRGGVWPETLLAGGDMGRRILEHDWSRTPVGPIGEWPTTLRSVVSLVVENSVPSILYWGEELTALYNDAYLPLLGTKGNVLGRSLWEIWPEALDTLEPVVTRARAGQASLFHNSHFTLHRNGRPEDAWFDWGFSPVRDETGAVVGVLNTTIEQTERTRSEQALKRSQDDLRRLNETLEQEVQERTEQVREREERFRRLVEASAASVWTSGPEGSMVEQSPSWRAYTGQSLEESRGEGWLDAIHPEDRDMVRADWERCVAEGGSQDLEHRVWNEATQSYRWVSGRAVPLRDADGEIRGWIGMDVDIDERKRAEQRVRELAARLTVVEQDERRRIAQILHDDLQQMLHGVDVKLDIAMRRLKDSAQPDVLEELEEARWWIAQGVAATRNLTADLSPPILGHESLTDSLRWLCRHMRDLHGLLVSMDAEQPFPLSNSDLRILLFHVVRELLVNVKKHAGVSHADLDLEEVDGRLVIHVRDTGKGFDPAHAWDGADTAPGFGLFSIRERLALVGGRLDVASAPGKGTHVRVFAPLG